MEQLIYRISLILTGLINLGMAVFLLRHTSKYKKYPTYMTTRILTIIWLVSYCVGYMVHAVSFWRYTWPSAASALTASYFHIGAICFNWGYTSLLDPTYLKKKILIRDTAIFVFGLICYWTVALTWVSAPTYTLISFCVFFIYAVLTIIIFYRTYNRVSYRMMKMSIGSVHSFVRWMQVCCDFIILFGVSSVVITGMFPYSLWPYVLLLFAGVGMFGYIVYSLEKYGGVIDDATRAAIRTTLLEKGNQKTKLRHRLHLVFFFMAAWAAISLTSCQKEQLTIRQEIEADSLINSAYRMHDYERILLPKSIANANAQRKDSAIAVGLYICQALDTAIVWERQNAAIELATIYDTQQKEKEIMEQRAGLSHQRFTSSIISLMLIVFSFCIFIYFRYQSAMRLESAYHDLEVANARAEESSRIKSEFIQQISHEIRTPLNILSGYTQIITSNNMELDAATRQDINQQVIDNTNRITGLVNKMLELSDAKSKTVIECTDTVPAVQIAMEAVTESNIEKVQHLVFSQRVSPEVSSVTLQTNRSAAVRALSLLLDNAKKFTAPAEGENSKTQDKEQAKQHAELRLQIVDNFVEYVVEDTGIGIPEEEAERIFEEFVQLDEYYVGTGIGLTVARSLAQRLGGDIVLDTSYTNGARFVMALPQKVNQNIT